MVVRRIHGASNSDIAQEFKVSKDTVERSLSFAKRAGLVTQFEDQILQDLVPEAIKAFKKAMENGDTTVALEVFKGTGLLLRPSEKVVAPKSDEGDLASYIKQIRLPNGPNQSALPPASESSAPAGSAGEGESEPSPILEAEILAPGGESRIPDAE